jgi:hypothetical protein
MIPFNDGDEIQRQREELEAYSRAKQREDAKNARVRQREADATYGAAAPRSGAYEDYEIQRQREELEAYSRAKQRKDAENARARKREADARYGAAAPRSGVADEIQRQNLLLQQDREERARKQESFIRKMRDKQEARIRKMRDGGHISKSAGDRLLEKIASRRKMTDGTGAAAPALVRANPFNFELRLKSARIMVIGAGYLGTDLERWSQIDPNYIGVSFMHDYDENPIPGLGSWDNDSYWERLFEIINRKFEAIYIDIATLHHMIHHKMPIEKTPFGRFIRYIYDNNITNLLYAESRDFDVNTVQKKWDKIMITNRYPDGHVVFYKGESREEMEEKIREGFQKDLKIFEKKVNYRNQFFKCCGEPQYVPMHDGSNGIWKSYQRRQ